MKYQKIILISCFIVLIPSCTSVTNSYEQNYSFSGDETILYRQKHGDDNKLPYPKDACKSASDFFRTNFSRKHLAVDGPFTISLFNDSVWKVECPVRYGITTEELSWGGFDKHSTLLLSRKNGEVLYFTIRVRTKPEKSKDHFLEWTNF